MESPVGVTALEHPLEVPQSIPRFDVWVLLVVALWLLFFMLKSRLLGRLTGAAFIVAYAVYLIALMRG